jgi:hypothetical protein
VPNDSHFVIFSERSKRFGSNTSPEHFYQEAFIMTEPIVNQLAERCGVNAEQVRKGLGDILEFLKGKLPADVFSKVSAAVPGAEAMMAHSASTTESSGGFLGAVTGAVGKLFGGGATELVSKLTQHGFSADQLQAFVPSVVEFFKSRLPADVAAKIAPLLPASAAAAK